MRTNDGKATERLGHEVDNTICGSYNDIGGILNASLGLSGEVGELNDMIKKWIFHGHDLDIYHVQKEIGDIMWYVAMMCESFGLSLDGVMKANIDKLEARYPEGFNTELSKNRKVGDF